MGIAQKSLSKHGTVVTQRVGDMQEIELKAEQQSKLSM